MSDAATSLRLPIVMQSQLDVRPIDWSGLTKRFMNPGELEVLIALVRSVSPKAVIEIGVNEGRTAKAILANVDGIEKYIGVDVPPGYVTAREVQRKEVPEKPGHLASGDGRFELMLRPRGSMDLSESDFPGLFDAVFIDGDHGFEAVLHDTLLARQIVRPEGIIIWHDYHGQDTVDVRKVLERFRANGSDIRHVEGTWLAFERV
ncbi:MAG: class I SAM-dependent methyltransferase [Pseudaminobacter sp.]